MCLRFIFIVLFSIAVTSCTYGMNYIGERDRRENERYLEAVVLEIGTCSNNTCSVKLMETGGNVIYTEMNEPTSVGRTVFKKCWDSPHYGNVWCYINYSSTKK